MIFFIDGASSIKKNIEKYFSYCSTQIDLDWQQVSFQIDSMIGRGTIGTIEDRKNFRRHVKSLIWYYCYADALKYIKELKAKHSTKSGIDILTKAQNCPNNKLPILTCYGLRKSLGLTNTSNRAERYNGLMVSPRQKHQAASWSRLGSINQALIKCAELNGLQGAILQAINSEEYLIDLFRAAA